MMRLRTVAKGGLGDLSQSVDGLKTCAVTGLGRDGFRAKPAHAGIGFKELHLAPPPIQGSQAFTMVELLVVMAIIALLIGLAVPAVNTVFRGSQLTQGGQIISDQLGLARQTALSKNHAVEVRFYQFGDPEVPGEATNNPVSGKYRAMQSFEKLESGAFAALGKVQRLPAAIILDKNATLSTVIGSPGAISAPTLIPSTQPQTVSIPRVGLQYNSISFQFRPDGSTNLPTGGLWFLTAHSMNDGDDLKSPPKNFFTVQIDASNGQPRYFRP